MTERAMDRKVLAREQTGKTSKWPRTDRRLRRIQSVLARRQPDLTVALENVHDPHNVSAVLRSCDATGTLGVHTIYSVEPPPPRAYARTVSAGAAKWIDVEHHASVDACYRRLREHGFVILAAALSEESRILYELDLTRPVALVFGNEMRGLSDAAIDQADATFEIPMRGMIESLNISVACAVSLFEVARQRAQSGHYEEPKLSPEQMEALTQEWLRR
jgi:tRNA (guanosine-2'-O-)-methyltransferase